MDLATACRYLQDVDLSFCREMTDAAVVAIAKGGNLRKLVLASCGHITGIFLTNK